jgi:2-dehydro-3-deoxyphosphogluconate aldolase/(4S)-4-hydroxy-2-oxoglutarate aldolase
MARFDRISVAQTMGEQGMVPLFYHPDLDTCKQVLKACYQGGARLLEFTNRGDFAHEVFGELNKYCAAELPEMILGVGSVTDAGSTALYLQLGANFVVTPVFRKDIAIACNRKKVLWAAGCATLTEIAVAEEYGAEIVKLFPGSVYGPDFIKSIKGPQPWTHIMPTGGVDPTEASLKSWFKGGAYCVGMGSKLMRQHADGSYDLEQIQALTEFSLSTIASLRT